MILFLQFIVLFLLLSVEGYLVIDFFEAKVKPEPLPGDGISLLVPFRGDGSTRQQTWDWLFRYWRNELPGAQIVMGHNDQVPFCKTAAVNHSFSRATGDIVVILDADCYIDSNVILACAGRIRAARGAGQKLWFIPYRHFYRLNKRGSELVIGSSPLFPLKFPSPPPSEFLASNKGSSSGHWFGALIQVMPREAFIAAGGMDERFHGWGGEDIAFMRAVDTLYAKHKTSNNDVLHLWHPTILSDDDVRMWPGQAFANENGPLAAKYHTAFGDRALMQELVNGG